MLGKVVEPGIYHCTTRSAKLITKESYSTAHEMETGLVASVSPFVAFQVGLVENYWSMTSQYCT